ncbi:glycosyltransferase [Draconibacterium sp. IB214405]|uniref:glycosyltransferase n=1 Tax=Draconibacterium sp. IB214405 TaxID=3097352 RepID=UPI002A150EE5|nr:glycosyltransferase [Draconibacterium sp. IB214405]MDX8338072.1 glycosyltransferase [Draconibacterium sp. IB214405]
MLAPILLFVYNRPWHTEQTIKALQKNELALVSELFIYSDAPKNESSVELVDKVRDYINGINGFKNVEIIERTENWGLAKSIIDGVTEIVNRYGKVIVLEDDIVTSPYFLTFMNNALDFYNEEKKVWHISGWNYPVNPEGLGDAFLWRGMNCWGWATWADRWRFFEKDTDELIKEFSEKDISRFNIDGAENYWGQVLDNRDGRINTWAVFWYATFFKRNGLSLNPVRSFVNNIGFDNSGVHCGTSKIYENSLEDPIIDISFRNINLNEDEQAVLRLKEYRKRNRKSKIDIIKYSIKQRLKALRIYKRNKE